MDGGTPDVGVLVPDGDKAGVGGGSGKDARDIGSEPPVGVGKGVLQVGVPGGVPP